MEHITKIKTVFAILLLYIIIVPPLYAQSISVRSLPGYVKAINQFNQLNPQEKVYLHFDNTGYYLGDTSGLRLMRYLQSNFVPPL